MMTTSRIVEVAGSKAQAAEQRMPSYSAELVKALVEAVRLQNEGDSQNRRRERLAQVVDALARKVTAAQRGQD